ncbi:MAG: hypothetical protein A4E65_03093 [Syntrophorhabdus sp. PtaU1.Bin153]|nr:MAG: hypothetical protein A4E65_03093 [Syntrophorhabdus sp. PtaU1.Bin153]
MADQNFLSLLQWGISVSVPAVSGLCGVFVGSLLAGRREKANRHRDFLTKQLTEFYSPVLAIRKEIKAMRDTEIRISRVADTASRKLCDGLEGNPDALRKATDGRHDAFAKIIDYNNEHLATECIPSYRSMADIFRKNLWLAEPTTVSYFPLLLDFISIWDRFLAGALPREVVRELDHSEEALQPLYDELQKKHDELREELAKGS